jgi:hypothetical protein
MPERESEAVTLLNGMQVTATRVRLDDSLRRLAPPLSGIVRFAMTNHVDLITMCTHGRTARFFCHSFVTASSRCLSSPTAMLWVD